MKRRGVLAAVGAVAAETLAAPVRVLARALNSAQGWSPLEIFDESSVFIDLTVMGERQTALLDTGATRSILDMGLIPLKKQIVGV